MANRATLNLNTKNFEDLIAKLDELDGDIKAVVEDALNQAGETIEYDTLDAIALPHLPRKGKYSDGDTEKSVIRNPQVQWHGTVASISVGFDYDKPGAGGFLITGRGTPRHMNPDYELQKMYKGKKYMRDIANDMSEIVNDAIVAKMRGG